MRFKKSQSILLAVSSLSLALLSGNIAFADSNCQGSALEKFEIAQIALLQSWPTWPDSTTGPGADQIADELCSKLKGMEVSEVSTKGEVTQERVTLNFGDESFSQHIEIVGDRIQPLDDLVRDAR